MLALYNGMHSFTDIQFFLFSVFLGGNIGFQKYSYLINRAGTLTSFDQGLK